MLQLFLDRQFLSTSASVQYLQLQLGFNHETHDILCHLWERILVFQHNGSKFEKLTLKTGLWESLYSHCAHAVCVQIVPACIFTKITNCHV